MITRVSFIQRVFFANSNAELPTCATADSMQVDA
jgi:hypothetical protein